MRIYDLLKSRMNKLQMEINSKYDPLLPSRTAPLFVQIPIKNIARACRIIMYVHLSK